MTAPDLRSLSVGDLLGTYGRILDELQRRSVIRTRNAPLGDYAEFLLATYFGVEPEPNSNKSFDLVTRDGITIQVKARILANPANPGDRQLSVIRSWDFDQLAVVLFAADYSIARAVLIPTELARASSRRVDHVNGQRLFATEALLDHPSVRDITDGLRVVAESL